MTAFLNIEPAGDAILIAPALAAPVFAVTAYEVKETVQALESAIGLEPPTALEQELADFIDWLMDESLLDRTSVGDPEQLAAEYLAATDEEPEA